MIFSFLIKNCKKILKILKIEQIKGFKKKIIKYKNQNKKEKN